MTDAPERLLLVGAGHTHLALIAQADRLRAAGYHVMLLSPPRFFYSGMASATATAAVPLEAGQIDVAALAARNAVEHVVGQLVGIDPEAKTVTDISGQVLEYDVCSLNVGSETAPAGIEIGDPATSNVLGVKPLVYLFALRDFLTGGDRFPGRPITVCVFGGGTSGIEIAANLAARDDVAQVHLVETGPAIGADLPRGARRHVTRLLERRGVAIHTDVVPGQDIKPHDVAVVATGLRTPAVFRNEASGGIATEQGLEVDGTLRHLIHRDVYALGDCAHFTPRPLPRVGVHGVRQAPVMLESLLARRSSEPLPVYRPQRRWLAILDLGGTGLAVRGRFWFAGKRALAWKRRIDRRWLDQYR